MIETYVRNTLQPLFNTLGTLLVRARISADTITFISFVTGALAAFFIGWQYTALSLFFVLLSGLCDVMDGTVARLSQSSHKMGAYIDLISDRMVEFMIILGFTYAYPQHYIAYIIFLGSVLLHFSTFVVAGTLFPNIGKKSMHYDASLVERAEAFVVFILMILFPSSIFWLLMSFNSLVLLSGITRFLRVLEYARSLEKTNGTSKQKE